MVRLEVGLGLDTATIGELGTRVGLLLLEPLESHIDLGSLQVILGGAGLETDRTGVNLGVLGQRCCRRAVLVQGAQRLVKVLERGLV